ncbi:MAG: 4Fe-4S binding protein [Bacteroidales bacterium]|nr:4Fe-4S binding protein [Bacteroidales bacterium]
MMNLVQQNDRSKQKYGPGRNFVIWAVRLGWPFIKFGKILSNVPLIKWLIYPFFMRPYNEISSIPLNIEVPNPESVVLPRRVVQRLLTAVDDIFIFDECICRRHNNVSVPPQTIGCMALGPAGSRIHPSHGKMATIEEAFRHVDRAAEAGLVANFAHVWIDPVAFHTRFHDLMFICYCDDKNCLYRTYMKNRGPSLKGAYQRLPGLLVVVDPDKCEGCGTCKEQCFLADISLVGGKAVIGRSCAGCGRCVEICPNKAIALKIKNEEALFEDLVQWIKGVSHLPIKSVQKGSLP